MPLHRARIGRYQRRRHHEPDTRFRHLTELPLLQRQQMLFPDPVGLVRYLPPSLLYGQTPSADASAAVEYT